MGGKRVSLHTSVLEEKATGAQSRRKGGAASASYVTSNFRAQHCVPGIGMLPPLPSFKNTSQPYRPPLPACLPAACNMICCYADELKEGFYPYVEQVGGVVGGWPGSGGCWGCWIEHTHACGLPALACGSAAVAASPPLRSTLLTSLSTLPSTLPPTLPPLLPPTLNKQVTQIMVPLLKFYFNEEVRASAAQVGLQL